jgi:hypothetical protein
MWSEFQNVIILFDLLHPDEDKQLILQAGQFCLLFDILAYPHALEYRDRAPTLPANLPDGALSRPLDREEP